MDRWYTIANVNFTFFTFNFENITEQFITKASFLYHFHGHLYLSDKIKNLTGALAQAKSQVNMREDDQELVCLMHNQKASRPILLNRFSGMVGKLLANDNKMAYEEYVSSTWYYDK